MAKLTDGIFQVPCSRPRPQAGNGLGPQHKFPNLPELRAIQGADDGTGDSDLANRERFVRQIAPMIGAIDEAVLSD